MFESAVTMYWFRHAGKGYGGTLASMEGIKFHRAWQGEEGGAQLAVEEGPVSAMRSLGHDGKATGGAGPSAQNPIASR